MVRQKVPASLYLESCLEAQGLALKVALPLKPDGTFNKETSLGQKGRYGRSRIKSLWEEYLTRFPWSRVSEPRTLMEFMRTMGHGMRPQTSRRKRLRGGKKGPASSSLMQYFDLLQCILVEQGAPIDTKVAAQVRLYIQNELREELDSPLTVRPRRWPRRQHFIYLMEQLLAKDWTLFPVPAIRIHLWAWVSCSIGSASRVGELVESSARGYNCNRGLKFEDCKLTVIRKENGQPGLAFEFERDAKGMTLEPDQRPRHSIYEAPDGESLHLNPIFPVLAIILSRKALRHYETIEELLQIPAPPAEENLQLLWKEEMLSQPVFPRFRRGLGLVQGMETANKMADRLRSLGIRAGFPEPLTTHDFRAEHLQLLDLRYSAAQRQRSAGHRSKNVFRRYQPKNSGTDGFGLFFYSRADDEVNETLRASGIEYYPDLIQTLSATMEDGVYRREQAKIDALEKELLKLQREKAPKLAKNKLWKQKSILFAGALSELQHQGCIREGDPLRRFFDRVRHVMPERNTIAELSSAAISLRSPEGVRALDSMITLCKATSEIRTPIGLETCHCLKSNKGWDHVYSCSLAHLKHQHGSAGYCFFCQKWYTGDGWSDHCEEHLSGRNFRSPQSRDPRSSLLCNPIKLEGVLVTPGLCPFCLSNGSLGPCRRFQQFRDAQVWSCHLLEHCAGFTRTSAPISCPHPSCSSTLADTEDLKRHLMDFHCPPHGLWSPRSTLRPSEDMNEDGFEQSSAAGVVDVQDGNDPQPKKPPPPPPPPRKSASQLLVAQYGYDAAQDDELSFREGDCILLLKQTGSDNEWWFGELNGKRGSFPANYCIPAI